MQIVLKVNYHSNRPKIPYIVDSDYKKRNCYARNLNYLKFENKIFCGDLCMNGLGASRRAPTWIYNKYDMLASWTEIMNSGAEYVYPGHGKPFKTSSLKSASEFWKTRGVLRLYANKR